MTGVTESGAWSWYSLTTGLTSLVVLARFTVAYERDTPRAGLLQRTMVALNWTWIALLGLRRM